MACDICGKNTNPLADLLDVYQTEEIRQVCRDCEKAINRQLSKVRAVTHNIFVDLARRAMRGMRERSQP